jgi:hypothetical protein
MLIVLITVLVLVSLGGVINSMIDARRAANAAKEVKRLLELSNEAQEERAAKHEKTAEKTFRLVNSGALLNARLFMVVSRKYADYTKDPADEQIAATAEAAYKEHEKTQAQIDEEQK